jgi:hypothetical protein
MKHDELRSVAHNLAHSLASGIGLLIGAYDLDVFAEAGATPEGYLTVDFLKGVVFDRQPSEKLAKAIASYKEALPSLCEKQGGSVSEFRELTVRYYGRSEGRRFVVTVQDQNGKRSSTDYEGSPGHRIRVLDGLGRIRSSPVKKS